MTIAEIIAELKLIVETLETIDIHGKVNYARMLGCIQHLDEMATKLEQKGE